MAITKSEALAASTFHIGTCRKRWRRNGQTKTWKTRPSEWRIPVKFGLYTYGYITDLDDNAHVIGSTGCETEV